MAQATWESSRFYNVWQQALEDYANTLPKEHRARQADLRDLQHWKGIASVDDLVCSLEARHDDFKADTARDSKHSRIIHDGLGGLEILMKMLGGAATATFPPSSQLLGAFSVMIDAGKGVSKAFDTISGLFGRLKEFSKRLRVLTEYEMEPLLQDITVGLLVCLLRICSLATRKAYSLAQLQKEDESTLKEKQEHPHLHYKEIEKIKQTIASRVSQFAIELAHGGDPEIDNAVNELDGLVNQESRMTQALTKKDTAEINAASARIESKTDKIGQTVERIESVALEFRGMNIDIKRATYDILRDSQTIKLELVEIGERIDAGFASISVQMSEETTALKAALQESTAELKSDARDTAKELNANFDALKSQNSMIASVVKKTVEDSVKKTIEDVVWAKVDSQDASHQPNNREATKAKEHAEQLKDLLHPPPANLDLFNKFSQRAPDTCEWILNEKSVLQWLGGDVPLLVISGQPGSGKTYLAARMVEVLKKKQSEDNSQTSSFAYFFCRKTPREISATNQVLRSLAFQIATYNTVYFKHVNSQSKAESLRHAASVQELWETLFVGFFSRHQDHCTKLIIDAVDECQKDSDATYDHFVNALKETSAQNSTWNLKNVQLMMFVGSDQATSLTDMFGEHAAHLMIEAGSTEQDLERIVDDKLTKSWKRSVIDEVLQEAVRREVPFHCKGDLLRASLLLEDLTSLSREDDIWALLSRPPKTVPDAVKLVFNRLARRLDDHGREDLVDILAWVACSHRDLSLAELDALLNIRNPEGCRLINLRSLIENDFSALFVLSTRDVWTDTVPVEKLRTRLGDENGDCLREADMSSHDEANGVGHDLHAADTRKYYGADATNMNAMTIMLASNISEQVNDASQAFSLENLQCKTLLGCLRAICDPPDTVNVQASKIANQYCALYLPEHLGDVDLEKVEAKKTRDVVKLLLQALRDPKVIDRWITVAATNMTNDYLSIPTTEQHLLAWLKSRDLQGRLPQGDINWIEEAIRSPSASLFLELAHGHARRWLSTEIEWINPNFEFLNAYIHKTKAKRQGEGTEDDNQPMDHAEDRKSYSVYSCSPEDILEVAEWAPLDRTPQWHRRVGFALQQADHYERAIEKYKEAERGDPKDPITQDSLGMAYWLWSGPDDSGAERLKCGVTCFESAIRLYQDRISLSEADSDAAQQARTACLSSNYYLAFLYKDLGRKDDAIAVYQKLAERWEDYDLSNDTNQWRRYAACSYLDMLMEGSQNEEAVLLLGRIVNHPQSRTPAYYGVYIWLLDSKDSLFKLICKENKFELLDCLWRRATHVVASCGDDGEVAAVRWARAYAMARLSPHQRPLAIELLKMIVQDREVSTAASALTWVRIAAEKELGRLYLDTAIDALNRFEWPDMGNQMSNLYRLNLIKEDAGPHFKPSESSLYLAALNQIYSQFHHAKQCVTAWLGQIISQLYNLDPDDDAWAWSKISRATLAAGDEKRAIAAWGMVATTATYGNKSNIVSFAKATSTTAEPSSETEENCAIAAQGSLAPGEASIPSDQEHAIPSQAQFSNGDGQSSEAVVDKNNDPATQSQDQGGAVADVHSGADLDIATDGQNEQPAAIEANSTGFSYDCDSSCFGTIPANAPMYRCRYCSTDLCETCHARVKSGESTEFAVCSKNHSWLLLPALKEEYPEGMIKVGEKFVPVKEWLADLLKEYGLPAQQLPNDNHIQDDATDDHHDSVETADVQVNGVETADAHVDGETKATIGKESSAIAE